jgi:hypothetical protein
MIGQMETHTIDEFVKNPQEYLKRLRETGEPEILSVDKNCSAVILDYDAYCKIRESLEQADLIASIGEGVESIRKGEGTPIEDFHATIETEFPFLKPT